MRNRRNKKLRMSYLEQKRPSFSYVLRFFSGDWKWLALVSAKFLVILFIDDMFMIDVFSSLGVSSEVRCLDLANAEKKHTT